jgi:hypothetical protein
LNDSLGEVWKIEATKFMKIKFNFFKNILSKTTSHKKKIATLAVGHSFGETIGHIFNYWIYIPIIAIFGLITGGILMSLASFAICYFILLFYDWSKTDWLGIELLKEANYGPDFLHRMSNQSKITQILWWPFHQIFKLVCWAQNKGGIAAFFVLSVYTDPFMTTIFLRREKFSGLSRRDWMIFIGSVILGNFYWTLRTALIIIIAKFGIKELI